MPKTALLTSQASRRLNSQASSSKFATHRVPDQNHDYRLDPSPYPALKTEQGVFTTPPYSAEIKGSWRYKDEDAARESSATIWRKFLAYQKQDDFIGADTARKFIQMGRTRSLRYALRPGGKKYQADSETGEKKEMKRTGKVYDEAKLKGAGVFEEVLKQCWDDQWYMDKYERWKRGDKGKVAKSEGGEKASVVKVDEESSAHKNRHTNSPGSKGRIKEEVSTEDLSEVKEEEL